MSDDPDRPDLTPDELASAHVDGLATPDQQAHLATDPALRDRVARLQSVRDAVRSADLPPDPDRREAAIAAALAAAAPPAAPVVELAARRRATRRLGWAAAAAAAAALALVLPRVLDRDAGSDRTTVAAAPKSAPDESSAELDRSADADTFQSGAASAGAAAPDAGSTTTVAPYLAGPLADLGAAADLEDLAPAARRALAPSPPTPAAPSEPPSPEDTACLQQQAATATTPVGPDQAPPTVILAGTATVDGERVLVLVVEQPDGRRELIAAKAGGCELLGTIGL